MPKKTPTVKEQVRAYLKAHDSTQVALAGEIGIAQSHLSDILSGKTPSLHVAVRLERLTGVPAREFAGAVDGSHTKRVGA